MNEISRAIMFQNTNILRPAIYVASKASVPARPAMWRALRALGARIVSTWIDEAGEGETLDFCELWIRVEREIRSSDRVVLYVMQSDLPLKGALVEVGMALAMGKPIFVVAPDIKLGLRHDRPLGSWVHHPNVKFFDDVRCAVGLWDKT